MATNPETLAEELAVLCNIPYRAVPRSAMSSYEKALAIDTEMKVEAITQEESEADLPLLKDLLPGDMLHDTQTDKYLTRNKKGEWDKIPPMTSGALDRMLMSKRVPRKRLDEWKAEVKSFNARLAVFDQTEAYVTVDGRPHLNTYRPGKVEPKAGSWDNIKALILNLVGGDQAAADYLLDWTAAPLQSLRLKGKPMKMGTAVVLQGAQGSGKDTYLTLLEALYGSSNVALLGQSAIDGRFNDSLIDKLLVRANEVMSSTNRSTETANKLKMWITDPVIPVEGKFESVEFRPNYFNIVFNSNDQRPVIIEGTDRRYSAFVSSPLDKTLAAAIYQDLEGTQAELSAWFDHLLTRKVTVKYGETFATGAKTEMMEASMLSDESFAHAVLTDGLVSVADAYRARNNPDATWCDVDAGSIRTCSVTRTSLMNVYKAWCDNQGYRPVGAKRLYKTLRAIIPSVQEGWVRSVRGLTGVPFDTRSLVVVKVPPVPPGPSDSVEISG